MPRSAFTPNRTMCRRNQDDKATPPTQIPEPQGGSVDEVRAAGDSLSLGYHGTSFA